MTPKPEVRLKNSDYQPKKEEIGEVVQLDGTPEEMRAAVMRSVKIVEDPKA